MDEAFLPLSQIVERMLAFPIEIVDEEAGVRSTIYECEIDSPVELDVVRDENGVLQIGSTPPIYYVDTTLRPSFHRLRFVAHLDEDADGNDNTAWQLEDFVDSLVVELDKTRETLAVKAINKPLSYTVKEVTLDLNIFPSYDGDQVKFITAQPGQEGTSKVTIQLGSITDQQVRATTKTPVAAKNDIDLDSMKLDKSTKKQLRKLGVNSVDDLKQIEDRNVDLKKVSDNEIDYSSLANIIQKSRRDQNPPQIGNVSMSMDEHRRPILLVQGHNLAVDPKFHPVAVVNQTLAEVMSYSDKELKIQITKDHDFAQNNEVILTFDPFAVLKVNVKVGGGRT